MRVYALRWIDLQDSFEISIRRKYNGSTHYYSGEEVGSSLA